MTRLLTGHLPIFISVFFVCYGIVALIPNLFAAYRERYQTSSRRTARELSKFFINIKPTQIFIGSAVLAILMGVLSGSWVIGIALAIAGAFAPRILLSVWKEIRSTQFEAQLMDALLLLGNSLKSGLDIVAGIERVATTMKPPISEEFGLVMNAYKLGTQLETALMDLTARINSRTLETVVYAVNIQRETGGNIIKTFDQLIMTIREESKLQKKARAMSAQARTQIAFLAGFPWVLGVVFYFAAPDFMQPALANPWGQITLVFLILWEIVGVLVTKKIVTVDV
jgi:tight adherence protein B